MSLSKKVLVIVIIALTLISNSTALYAAAISNTQTAFGSLNSPFGVTVHNISAPYAHTIKQFTLSVTRTSNGQNSIIASVPGMGTVLTVPANQNSGSVTLTNINISVVYLQAAYDSCNYSFQGAMSSDVADMETVNLAKASADAAATNATSAYNAVSNVNGNTVTAVRDADGTVLSVARQANTKLDTMQTSITNIQNSIGADTTPPSVKLRTVSGAVATSGATIQTVLDISDNTNSSFTYSLDGAAYAAVPVNRIVFLPVNTPGPNIIPVWVKDQAGNMGMASITIRKL